MPDFRLFLSNYLQNILETLENERNHSDENYMITNLVIVMQVLMKIILIAANLGGYRPSDDVCYYKFFIPGNMFAVATLEKSCTSIK